MRRGSRIGTESFGERAGRSEGTSASGWALGVVVSAWKFPRFLLRKFPEISAEISDMIFWNFDKKKGSIGKKEIWRVGNSCGKARNFQALVVVTGVWS